MEQSSGETDTHSVTRRASGQGHHAPDGALVTHTVGVIHDANPTAVCLFGRHTAAKTSCEALPPYSRYGLPCLCPCLNISSIWLSAFCTSSAGGGANHATCSTARRPCAMSRAEYACRSGTLARTA